MTDKVASQVAAPVGLVASHLYIPASRCLQLLMTRVETPKTFEIEYLLLRLMGSLFLNQVTAGSGFPENATENLACLRSLTTIGFMGMDRSHGRLKSILVRFGMSAIWRGDRFWMTERSPEMAGSPLPNSFSAITLKK